MKDQDKNNSWLTVKEASSHYRIKRSTLYLWVEQRTIPHYKIGRLIRFKSDELNKWLENFKKEADTPNKTLRKRPRISSGYDADDIVRKAIDEVKGGTV